MQTTRTTFQKNTEVNLAFGNPQGNSQAPNWPTLARQFRITLSEFNELAGAVESEDFIKFLDGQGDVTTTNDGIAHIAGFDLDHAYSLLTDEEKADLDQFPNYFGDKHSPNWEILRAHVEFMRPVLEGVEKYISESDFVALSSTVPVIDEANRVLAKLAGIDHSLNLDAIYTSNMSKLCATQEDVDATIAKYAAMDVTVDVFGEFPKKFVKSNREQMLGGEMIPAGKFLKGIHFKEPDFSKVMA